MTKSIIVDGVEYLPKKTMGNRVLVRCRNAGVHVGTRQSRDANVLVLTNANRIWRWRGANTLSEVSQSGVRRDSFTRISVMVPEIELTSSDVAEVIPVAADVDLSEVWND